MQLCAVDFTAYHLLRSLGTALRDAGFEVTFCCSAGVGLDRLKEEGFGVRGVPISRNYNILSHAVSFVRLFRYIRRERFTVVHAHTPIAGLIGRAAARLARTPVVVYTAHGFYFHEGMSAAARRFFLALERFGASLSDLVFVQSEEDWREAVEENVAPEDRMIHIGNGVDPAAFGRERNAGEAGPLRAELGLDGSPVIGFVGRIVLEKGALEFVKSAALVKSAYPSAKFLMVGAPLESDRDGCWNEVNRLREESGFAEDLVLTGYRSDVPALLSILDVFVLPSHREGMPRALLEAMATGLPVVATDIRGCREEVVDGLTGFLVPRGDHRALAEAVIRILDSPDLASTMAGGGRRRVLEKFDERSIVSLQVDWIKRLLSRSG